MYSAMLHVSSAIVYEWSRLGISRLIRNMEEVAVFVLVSVGRVAEAD